MCTCHAWHVSPPADRQSQAKTVCLTTRLRLFQPLKATHTACAHCCSAAALAASPRGSRCHCQSVIVVDMLHGVCRSLRCPSSTAKSGELDVAHMNSWSHATNYPPIMLSGLVDLIHTHWEPLPEGETHLQPYLGGPPVSNSPRTLSMTREATCSSR
jgi:hypothetical protein